MRHISRKVCQNRSRVRVGPPTYGCSLNNMCKRLPWSCEHLRMRKWMDPTYGRRRSLPSLESSAEYLRLVRRFADLHGLRLPSSISALNADNVPAKDFQFHGLTDHQTVFLSFLEAMVIWFTKLFKPCVVPILSGTDAILSHPSWSAWKIGQWCQFLDRSSLMAIDRCEGLLDHRDQLLSAIAPVTLGSCPKVAANMLPLKCSDAFAKDLQSKLSDLLPEDIMFAYPRSLIHLMREEGKIQKLVFLLVWTCFPADVSNV